MCFSKIIDIYDNNQAPSVGLVRLLLFISVLASLSVSKFLISSFSLNIESPPFHSNYTIWFLLFLFLIVNLTGSWSGFLKFNKRSIPLFLLSVIFLLMENVGYILYLRHYGRTYIELFFWFALLYFIIERLLLSRKDYLVSNLYYLYRYYMILCLSIAIFFIINKLIFPVNPYINHVFLLGENFISYMAASGVLLLLHYPLRLFRTSQSKKIALVLLISTPFCVENIGGMIVVSVIVLLYLDIWMIALVSILGLVFLYLNVSTTEILQIYHSLTYGMTFEPLLKGPDVINLDDQLASTYIRNVTNFLAINEFFDSPLLGAGLFQIKEVLRFAGYWSHSWLVIVLSAYGLVSFIFVLAVIYLAAGYENNFKKTGYGSLIVFILLMGIFVNEIYPFTVVLIILYRFVNVVNIELSSKNYIE